MTKELDDIDAPTGWCAGAQTCWFCGHRQVCVWPQNAWVEQFACEGCGLMTAVPDDPDWRSAQPAEGEGGTD
jgi:hypothetical protein